MGGGGKDRVTRLDYSAGAANEVRGRDARHNAGSSRRANHEPVAFGPSGRRRVPRRIRCRGDLFRRPFGEGGNAGSGHGSRRVRRRGVFRQRRGARGARRPVRSTRRRGSDACVRRRHGRHPGARDPRRGGGTGPDVSSERGQRAESRHARPARLGVRAGALACAASCERRGRGRLDRYARLRRCRRGGAPRGGRTARRW
ncbi:MAG: hypothetical protein HLUCCA24_00065 [Rhodobacteraceae bacterium HLUCCA24]|nr:MAG: hypothetical protein HLUCCA24_00065 [Rhodobacteraceae bacterium HLUCCA24]